MKAPPLSFCPRTQAPPSGFFVTVPYRPFSLPSVHSSTDSVLRTYAEFIQSINKMKKQFQLNQNQETTGEAFRRIAEDHGFPVGEDGKIVDSNFHPTAWPDGQPKEWIGDTTAPLDPKVCAAAYMAVFDGDEAAFDEGGDDLCDKCHRSGVQISHTDEEGNTLCYDCLTDESMTIEEAVEKMIEYGKTSERTEIRLAADTLSDYFANGILDGCSPSAEELQFDNRETGEHPEFTKFCWGVEASVGDTILGYWEWVSHQIESQSE